MRDLLAFLLVLLSGPAVLVAFLGIHWPSYGWLALSVLTIALPHKAPRHG